MDHLGIDAHVGDVELDRPLISVEVVVEAGILFHKQRGGNPPQIEGMTEIHLEIALDELNGPLHFVDGEGRMIALGEKYLTHRNTSFEKNSLAAPAEHTIGTNIHQLLGFRKGKTPRPGNSAPHRPL